MSYSINCGSNLPMYYSDKQWQEKIRNLIHKNICGICMNVKKHLTSLDAVYVIENSCKSDQTLKDLVNSTLAYKVTNLLPTVYLCEECITIILQAYLLLQKINHNQIMLEKYYSIIRENLDNISQKSAKDMLCSKDNEGNINNDDEFEYKTEILEDSNGDESNNKEITENYLCSVCDEKFEDLCAYKTHYTKCHSNEELYHCKKCHEEFKDIVDLMKHRYNKHLENIEFCSVCNVILLTSMLREHLITHVNNFVCDLCNKVFFTKKSIRSHIIHKHNSPNIFCKECLKPFKCKSRIKTHKCLFKCTQCVEDCIHKKYIKSFRNQYFSKQKIYKCNDCAYMYTKKNKLISHVNQDHLKYLPFLCHLCGNRFASKEFLLGHNYNRHKNAILKCEICVKGFKDESELTTHQTFYAIDRTFKCDICSSRFETEEKYTFHRRKHFDKEIQCQFCFKNFMSKSGFRHHIRRMHADKLDSKILECTMCLLDFKNKKDLLNHTLTHPEDSQHVCRVCSNSFKSKSNYFSHKRKHQYKKDKECPICKKKYDKHAIIRHIKSHTKNERTERMEEEKRALRNSKKTVMCDVCGALLTNERSLTKHKEIHKEQKQCPHCLKYINTVNYDIHINSHSKQRKRKVFNCTQCNYTSNFLECLEGHVNRYHLNLRPFHCDICKKSFYAKLTLREHIGTHLRLKPEQCEQCGKRFVNKKALKLHIRLHTGERPYPCDLCDEKFLSASRRQMHRIRKHFDPSVQCPLCPKLYYTQATMKKHVEKCHSAV